MADESSTATIEQGFVNEIDIDHLPKELPQDEPKNPIISSLPIYGGKPGNHPKLHPDAIKDNRH